MQVLPVLRSCRSVTTCKTCMTCTTCMTFLKTIAQPYQKEEPLRGVIGIFIVFVESYIIKLDPEGEYLGVPVFCIQVNVYMNWFLICQGNKRIHVHNSQPAPSKGSDISSCNDLIPKVVFQSQSRIPVRLV